MKSIYRTKEYFAWCDMRKRCFSSGSKDYPRYGGRGITIDDSWADFNQFLLDMGKAPSKKHSLDRMNNDQGYGPDNCRWATTEQQQNNRSDTRLFTFNNATKSIAQWARQYGFNKGTLYHRLINLKMPIELALAKGKL